MANRIGRNKLSKENENSSSQFTKKITKTDKIVTEKIETLEINFRDLTNKGAKKKKTKRFCGRQGWRQERALNYMSETYQTQEPHLVLTHQAREELEARM